MDLCDGSIKEAYKASPRPPFGSSDHCAIHLDPVHRPVLKKEKVENREIMVWNNKSVSQLQGCFGCAYSALNIDELTDTVSCYISFCEDIDIP